MLKKLWLGLIVSASVAVSASIALASGTRTETLIGNFPDADAAKLVHHHNQLFTFVVEDDVISAYAANRKLNDWIQVDADAPSVSDLLADSTDISTFAVYKGKIYVAAVNQDGVAQVWNICNHCRPAAWDESGAVGFGDTANTAVVDFFTLEGNLYAITENSVGNGLFMTSDGDSWEQVGEYGLGMSLTDLVAGNVVRVMDGAVHYASASGTVYHAAASDPASLTSVTTFDGSITAMRGRFVAVAKDGQTTVYECDTTGSYTQAGEAIDGEVNKFVSIRINRVEVLVKDETNGASHLRLDNTDSSWDALMDGGFDNSNNIAIDTYIRFHGKRYASTVNTTDGPEIYKISKH